MSSSMLEWNSISKRWPGPTYRPRLSSGANAPASLFPAFDVHLLVSNMSRSILTSLSVVDVSDICLFYLVSVNIFAVHFSSFCENIWGLAAAWWNQSYLVRSGIGYVVTPALLMWNVDFRIFLLVLLLLLVLVNYYIYNYYYWDCEHFLSSLLLGWLIIWAHVSQYIYWFGY